jgi:hypothetical protein
MIRPPFLAHVLLALGAGCCRNQQKRGVRPQAMSGSAGMWAGIRGAPGAIPVSVSKKAVSFLPKLLMRRSGPYGSTYLADCFDDSVFVRTADRYNYPSGKNPG